MKRIVMWEIAKFFKYENGDLLWKISHGFKKAGTQVARPHVTLNGVRYKTAEVVWALCTGHPPRRRIRNLNGDPYDIRFENLTDGRGVAGTAKPARRRLHFWVRMTVTEEGYSVELTEKGKQPLSLGTFPSYQQACTAQAMALYVPEEEQDDQSRRP